MTKNKLMDLNDHLFMQIERLSNDELTPEQIKTEAERANAMVTVADRIIAGGQLQLEAARLIVRDSEKAAPLLPMVKYAGAEK